MLASLSIQNVVLIDRLTIEGEKGLSALTGETGAGKSILLDALGLALGARADAGLVRHGCDQASVTAAFDLPAKHPLRDILQEKGIETDGSMILRRVVAKDGKSKAFINDAPVSVQLLKEAAAQLVEIHGQFETQGLLDPAAHLATLDICAGTAEDTRALRSHWSRWQEAEDAIIRIKTDIETARLQEEYLRHTVAELEKLDPQEGEEAQLAEKRQNLLNRQKMQSAYDQALSLIDEDDGIRNLMTRLQTTLARMGERTGAAIGNLADGLARAQTEMDEISYQIERLRGGNNADGNLEDVEERYFALRELAKKHRTTADQLPQVLADLAHKLGLITDQDAALAALQKTAEAARLQFGELAQKISVKRQKAAEKLSKAVNAELPPLKLEKARFKVDCEPMTDPRDWGQDGMDRVQFMVSTNPQTPFGPINKIASGGELSRFMLALKVILAETASIPTLIFDEADSGIGGATADAVGERLQRLAKKYQVLAITHSPQVAARAQHHWHVAKSEQKGAVVTHITPLDSVKARQEEIARMLSGAEVTREARAQAAKLLEQNAAA